MTLCIMIYQFKFKQVFCSDLKFFFFFVILYTCIYYEFSRFLRSVNFPMI